MDCAKTGKIICDLRRELGMTQKQLADKMNISDKTVSKWERGLGCPDISLLSELSALLGISLEQFLRGELTQNDFVGGNMKKSKYYVCPECGNLTVSTGDAEISCCGRRLEMLTPVKPDEKHELLVESVENEWFISSNHPMLKEHYISFIAMVKSDRVEIIKQYPEWNLQSRIYRYGHGMLLWYCTQDGLFCKNI